MCTIYLTQRRVSTVSMNVFCKIGYAFLQLQVIQDQAVDFTEGK